MLSVAVHGVRARMDGARPTQQSARTGRRTQSACRCGPLPGRPARASAELRRWPRCVAAACRVSSLRCRTVRSAREAARPSSRARPCLRRPGSWRALDSQWSRRRLQLGRVRTARKRRDHVFNMSSQTVKKAVKSRGNRRPFTRIPGSACWFLLSRGSGLANRPPQKGAGGSPLWRSSNFLLRLKPRVPKHGIARATKVPRSRQSAARF